MAKFKCMISGNTVEFEAEHDIADMRRHHQYEEVFEPEPEAASKEALPLKDKKKVKE